MYHRRVIYRRRNDTASVYYVNLLETKKLNLQHTYKG